MFSKKIYYFFIASFILVPILSWAQINDNSTWQQSYLLWKKKQQEIVDFNKGRINLTQNELKIKKLLLHSSVTNSVLETVILFLENIVNKIDPVIAKSQLNDEVKDKYLEDIGVMIDDLGEYQEEILNADNLTSLYETIFEIQKIWPEVQIVSRQATGRLNVVKWQSLYDEFSLYLIGMEEKIALLDQQEYDKDRLVKKISQAKSYLDKFFREIIIAKQVFDSPVTVNNSDQLYLEGIKSLRQMSEYLFSVKDILLETHSIIEQVKDAGIDNNKE